MLSPKKFNLKSSFKPAGDQPKAIKELTKRINGNKKFSTLLGVTGSGKTFTLASVISKLNRPVLVISHNKTLAGQLYGEFKNFFPQNAVEYFVSYYDYYQPESYIPQTDTYIEKDASINDRLDRLRLASTSSLLSRKDTIVVASVSCIYNLGSPEEYSRFSLYLKSKQRLSQKVLTSELIKRHYQRNDYDFQRGSFRVKGETVDLYPSCWQEGVRIQFFGDTVEKIYQINPLTGKKIMPLSEVVIFPAKHFLTPKDKLDRGLKTIKLELQKQLALLKKRKKLVEAQRLKQRTLYDLEMLKECQWCRGIENYSRHLSGQPCGSRPSCLIDYFPSDFITIIDESHVTIPQIKGMYHGDKSRKETLIEYGFRLPSCLDNRPLHYQEFKKLIRQTIFVSATPSPEEISLSKNQVIEQVIRPTGLVDPKITVVPAKNQIKDLSLRIKKRIKKNERSLITTLTKAMAEELTSYLKQEISSLAYIHSEINTLERAKIIKELRLKKIDALIGVNLLREGLDLPEVSLVAILDADKEGFLRSATALIQVAGRCARHINAEVVMYADKVTKSMSLAIKESQRRRKIQLRYNKKNKIIPKSVNSAIKEGIENYFQPDEKYYPESESNSLDLNRIITQLSKEMRAASKNLHYEKAASIRDKINLLKKGLESQK